MTDDIVARLRLYAQKQRETKSSVLGLLLSDSADEIERTRAERDEARREVCELRCDPPVESFIGLPHELAKINGWDCYGVTNGQHLRTSVAESSQEAP